MIYIVRVGLEAERALFCDPRMLGPKGFGIIMDRGDHVGVWCWDSPRHRILIDDREMMTNWRPAFGGRSYSVMEEEENMSLGKVRQGTVMIEDDHLHRTYRIP
jgi:hypothetical protein